VTANPLFSDISSSYTPRYVDEPSVAVEQRLRALLDDAYRALNADDISRMDEFVIQLNTGRRALPLARWRAFMTEAFAHPVLGLLHEDPFTRHAFEKPRGYAGDAELLDLIYRDQPYAGALSDRGARLYAWTSEGSACRSVRARRDGLASWIDRIANERAEPRILSVACGHLREAQRSTAVREGTIGELVALDQDARSIALIHHEQAHHKVTTVTSSFRRLIVAPADLGKFDFIYSAGLYDYLHDEAARRLTASMFAMLRPGGTLLVANFAPELSDIGYMDAMMDWVLIYRDEAQIDAVAASIPAEQIASREIYRDGPGNVVHLVLRRH
jgi:extracellular factor (EF) 3-hydroxypalmitic acid methyl ester biosynthesis protein